jgi:putative ABC transport system substrate-binding protein
VDIIVTWGTPATLAAKKATTAIPIVMATAGDPVRAGLVASLSRPGGNITGFSIASCPWPRSSLLRYNHFTSFSRNFVE